MLCLVPVLLSPRLDRNTLVSSLKKVQCLFGIYSNGHDLLESLETRAPLGQKNKKNFLRYWIKGHSDSLSWLASGAIPSSNFGAGRVVSALIRIGITWLNSFANLISSALFMCSI